MKMVSSKAQILQLTPSNEIVFEGPFEHVVTSYLYLKNPSDQKVCFKVKTTAPRRYCVRPNSGKVEPSGEVKIAIMLQPMEPESQAERSKHKFMVQSTIIQDDSINLDTVWQQATPDTIMDSKLRCVFRNDKSERVSGAGSNSVIEELPDVLGTAAATATTDKSSPASNIIQLQSETLQGGFSSQQSNTSSISQQQKQKLSETQKDQVPTLRQTTSSSTATPLASGDFGKQPATSTPVSSPNLQARADRSIRSNQLGDKSVASSHNLTSSFLQPMSDDYKIVLVSLIMLIIGVILGKYII